MRSWDDHRPQRRLSQGLRRTAWRKSPFQERPFHPRNYPFAGCAKQECLGSGALCAPYNGENACCYANRDQQIISAVQGVLSAGRGGQTAALRSIDRPDDAVSVVAFLVFGISASLAMNEFHRRSAE